MNARLEARNSRLSRVEWRGLMCGIAGCFDMRTSDRVRQGVLTAMTERLIHRGPDSEGYFLAPNVGLGCRRLAIVDILGGGQPIFNEDNSVVLVCNGEIFDHAEQRQRLEARGHTFKSNVDLEVLVHLYEDFGIELVHKINGQFAFALYDCREQKIFLARDQFGICPLHFTIVDGILIFASEIKALLAHPSVAKDVDVVGLDQIITFPGLVSPRTMFKQINSLPPGHYLTAKSDGESIHEYWDLEYPRVGEIAYSTSEADYVEELEDLLKRAVQCRLHADVPLGVYLSGGLDSSIVVALVSTLFPSERNCHTFSTVFADQSLCEKRHQDAIRRSYSTVHHEILFDSLNLESQLPTVVYHCECPIKEMFDVCSLAMSRTARETGVRVVLSGQGADELFGGYLGYRFDQWAPRRSALSSADAMLEKEMQKQLWGEADLFYERDYYAFRETKNYLYSRGLRDQIERQLGATKSIVNHQRLAGRDLIHKRSYLDIKLRLSEHLISEHGDRMGLANSVELRHPFLDSRLAEFVTRIPPALKINGEMDKLLLRKVGGRLLAPALATREKFGFTAPGSNTLMRKNQSFVEHLISPERIAKDGYFNPETVEVLKRRACANDFGLPVPSDDLLVTIISFNLLMDTYSLPGLN